MDPFSIAAIIMAIVVGIAGSVGSAVSSKKTNETNIALADKANETNIQLAREANAAQAIESQKAYERSKATSQVNLMRAAGMSKAGALNALNGGGVYTPAPVNTAQVSAPQTEDSGVQSAMQMLSSLGGQFSNAAQMHQQKKQFEADLDLRKKAQELERYNIEEQLKLEREKFVEEQLNNASMRSLNEASIAKIAKDMELTDAQVKQLAASTDLTWQQVQTEMEKTKLTAQQILDIQEHTKLTTQQILESRARVSEINQSIKESEERIKNMLVERGLTAAQSGKVWREVDQLDNYIDNQMQYDNLIKMSESEAQQLQTQILQLARDMKMDEKHIKHLERLQKQSDFYTTGAGNPVAVGLDMWSYVVSNMFPVGRTLGLSNLGNK